MHAGRHPPVFISRLVLEVLQNELFPYAHSDFLRSLHSLKMHFTADMAGLYTSTFSLCVRSGVLNLKWKMCFFHLETFKSPFFLCSIFSYPLFFVNSLKYVIVLNSWRYQSSGLFCQPFKYALKNVAWKYLHYSSAQFVSNYPCFCSYSYKTR